MMSAMIRRMNNCQRGIIGNFLYVGAFGLIIGVFISVASMKMFLLVTIGLMFVFLLLCFPEFFFGIYMSGLFGSFVYFSSFLSAIKGWSLLSVVAIGFYAVRQRKGNFFSIFNAVTFSQFIFAIILFVGVFYTPSYTYGKSKALHFLYWNLFPMIGSMVFINDPDRFKRIVTSFGIGAILTSLSGLYYFYNDLMRETHRLGTSTSSSIWFGRTCAIAAIFIIAFIVFSKRKSQLLGFPLLAIILFNMILSGSRGVLIAFFVSIVVFSLFNLHGKINVKVIFISCLVSILIVLGFKFAPEEFTQRYSVSSLEGSSAQTRVSLMSSAWQMFMNSPLVGFGTGAFHAGRFFKYPHNIFLEVAAELGLVGFSVFLTFIVLTFKAALLVLLNIDYRDEDKKLMRVIFCGFLFFLFEAQFSGDINGNALIWFFSGLIWATYAIGNNFKKNNVVM